MRRIVLLLVVALPALPRCLTRTAPSDDERKWERQHRATLPPGWKVVALTGADCLRGQSLVSVRLGSPIQVQDCRPEVSPDGASLVRGRQPGLGRHDLNADQDV